MPKKVRELKSMLMLAGFHLMPGGVKGSHSKWMHPHLTEVLTLSGKDGGDARHYQEKLVRDAIRAVEKGGRK